MSTIDTQAEIALIQTIAAENAKKTSAGGTEGAKNYAEIATSDALWLPPDAPAISGREAIAQYALGFTQMKDFEINWDHSHVVVADSGDIAYSVGAYKGSAKDDQGEKQVFEGKLVNIWHKQKDDSWKIAVGIWNTDDPTTPR
jgi:ketosteroid isomerase-like protein